MNYRKWISIGLTVGMIATCLPASVWADTGVSLTGPELPAENAADTEEALELPVSPDEAAETEKSEALELPDASPADTEEPLELPVDPAVDVTEPAADATEAADEDEALLSADAVIYDAASFSNLKNRTLQNVLDRYTQAMAAGTTYISSDSGTYYTGEKTSLSAPYAIGVLSTDTLDAMEEMTNFYRWLIGVDPLTANTTSNSAMQAQAFDRNFQFDHYISQSSKPADMEDALWNIGYSCTHNILARGYTPTGSITGWLNEGYRPASNTWDTVGHRTALLTPTESSITFGYSGGVSIGKCGSYGNSFTNAFAAFPAAGYMPNTLVSRSAASWTVNLNSAKVKVSDTSGVKITVTNTKTGASYTCTNANGYAQISTYFLNFRQPTDITSGYYTDPYRVVVTGLYDVATGKEAQITYTVNFFDLKSRDLSNGYASLSDTSFVATGSAVTPSVTSMTLNGTTLNKGTDYTVSYKNNTAVGTGYVYITGIGSYCGVKKMKFSIDKDTRNVSQCTVTLDSSNLVYDGTKKTPAATVTYYGTTLKQGVDYTISYSNNIEPGTATATITGKGSYSGKTTKTFTISGMTQEITLDSYDNEIETKGTMKIKASAKGALSYTSWNTGVATVDPDGTVHGISDGSATIVIDAAATGRYEAARKYIYVYVSKDYHTMVDASVTNATATNNTAAVIRKCSVCGKTETKTYQLPDSFSVWWWTGYVGSSCVSADQTEGASLRVSVRNTSPACDYGDEPELVITSSNTSVASVSGYTITFKKAGTAAITIACRYRPSVKITQTFTVNHSWDSGKITTAATRDKDGKKTYTCTTCGATKTEIIRRSGSTQAMNRLYNPNSGEHFYTASTAEKNNLVNLGWRYEGVGWTAPSSSKTPVYRLYNPNAGDHHYTMSAGEKDMLVGVGWNYEGIGWYSDDSKGVALYRQYNPNAICGSHNYTTSRSENDWLVSIGWQAEGIGWYGV